MLILYVQGLFIRDWILQWVTARSLRPNRCTHLFENGKTYLRFDTPVVERTNVLWLHTSKKRNQLISLLLYRTIVLSIRRSLRSDSRALQSCSMLSSLPDCLCNSIHVPNAVRFPVYLLIRFMSLLPSASAYYFICVSCCCSFTLLRRLRLGCAVR